MSDKLKFALGLAKKAGQTVTGTDLILEQIRHRQAARVIIAADASEGSRKKLVSACKNYNVKCSITALDKSQLSNALGLSGYTAAVAVRKHEIVNLIDRTLNDVQPDGQ